MLRLAEIDPGWPMRVSMNKQKPARWTLHLISRGHDASVCSGLFREHPPEKGS